MRTPQDHPTLAISMGDPGGIGPEVLVKALSDPALRGVANHHIYGCDRAMRAAAANLGIEPFWHATSANEAPPPGAPVVLMDQGAVIAGGNAYLWPAKENAVAGELSFRCVEAAIAACKRPEDHPQRAHAIVTGPINKAAWAMAGHAEFPGHTELLAARLGVDAAGERTSGVMMFVSPRLMVSLVTTHVPLASVAAKLSVDRILRVITLSHEACLRLGIGTTDGGGGKGRNGNNGGGPPRIAICGVNPHAGEGGLLGDEDDRIIRPAIEAARATGIDASGPWPGDTIFLKAVAPDAETHDARSGTVTRSQSGARPRAAFDLVVAMYHDQGLIPVKLLDRDRAVNTTLGLSVPRTSPDHGTAFDIAGRGIADPGSMRAAIELAVRFAATPAK